MRIRVKMSERVLLHIVLWSCIGISLLGIAISVCLNSPQDAGRGGAIAVALSFLALFTSRGKGARVFDILYEKAPQLIESLDQLDGTKSPGPAHTAEDRLKHLVTALKAWLSIDRNAAAKQNVFLAWSSCIGTLVWGFGDVAAGGLIACLQSAQ